MQTPGLRLQSPLTDHSGGADLAPPPKQGTSTGAPHAPKAWSPLPHGDKLQVPAENPTWRQDTAESSGAEAVGPHSSHPPSLGRPLSAYLMLGEPSPSHTPLASHIYPTSTWASLEGRTWRGEGTEVGAAEGAEQAVGGVLHLLGHQHVLLPGLAGQRMQLLPPGPSPSRGYMPCHSCPSSACPPGF